MLTRRTPMKRTPFGRKLSTVAESQPNREQRLAARAVAAMKNAVPRAATVAGAAVLSTAALPVAKEVPVRSEPYRRAVASLPCVICGVHGYSQAAHANTGKGASIKACDLQTFPACASRPGLLGCHHKLDQGALFTKYVRRELESVWVADTQRRIHAMGLWPKGVPYPHEDQGSNRDH